MREFVMCAALLIAAAGFAPKTNLLAQAAPAATDQASTLALAKEWFHRVQTGDIDHSQLNDAANMSLDADSVKELSAQVAPLGAPVTFVQQQVGSLGGNTSYTYALSFKDGTKIAFILLVDGNGKIAGISVQPG
ncbi:MAG TPA: hypothetical protein VK760_17000 [Candidatus Acidoferrales bacterium]|nr:hypothetical protein [Candidatus Acidoferrales bacterium]